MTDVTEEAARLAEAAAEWSATHRVRAGRWNVRYREAGRGPAVVLVHGLGVSSDYWWRNGPQLAAAGFRVLAPDLPGFGRTEGPPRLTVPEAARALARWADAMRLGPAAYVGHSLSAQCITELAAREPGRVTALVLAAPTGDRRDERLWREAWGLFLDVFREPFRWLFFLGQEYLQAGPIRFWRTWVAGKHHDPFVPARRVAVPAAVVIGSEDPVVPLELAEALSEAFPRGRFILVEGGAHGVIFDAPEGFNAAVIGFLREVLAEREG